MCNFWLSTHEFWYLTTTKVVLTNLITFDKNRCKIFRIILGKGFKGMFDGGDGGGKGKGKGFGGKDGMPGGMPGN